MLMTLLSLTLGLGHYVLDIVRSSCSQRKPVYDQEWNNLKPAILVTEVSSHPDSPST